MAVLALTVLLERLRTDLLAAVTLESDHVLTSAPSYSGAQSEAGSSVGDHFLFIDPLPRPVASMVSHNTPLLSPMTPFETCTGVLGISHATASILRDIRLLIDKVLALPTHGQLATRPAQGHVTGHRRTASSATAPPPRSGVAMSEAEMRVRETASWLQGNISEFAVRDRAAARRQWDPLHVAVLHAALLTTRAVAARRPVSQVDPTMPVAADERSTGVPGDTLSIWGHICQVPLERWRRIPGILLWIGVTAAPLKDASLPAPVQQLTSGTSPLARTATPSSSSSSAASPANLPYPSSPSPAFDCGILGARALVHVAALQIATEDWAVAEGTLRRAAALSAWLRGGAGLGHQHETTVTPAQPPASSAPAAAELGRPVIGSSNDIHRQERAAKRVNLGRGGGR